MIVNKDTTTNTLYVFFLFPKIKFIKNVIILLTFIKYAFYLQTCNSLKSYNTKFNSHNLQITTINQYALSNSF